MSNLAIALRFSSAAGLSVADEINAQIDRCPGDLSKTTSGRIVKQQLEGVKVGIKEFRDVPTDPSNTCSRFFVNSRSASHQVECFRAIHQRLNSCREGKSVTLGPRVAAIRR